MSPQCASTSPSAPRMNSVNAACASRSASVPSGLPGKHRFRFLPSSGTTNGARARNPVMFSTGTARTRPRSRAGSSAAAHRRTPAMDAYSQPCTPEITVSCGPSAAPVMSITGTPVPARSMVWRTTCPVIRDQLPFAAARPGPGPGPGVNSSQAAAATWSRLRSWPRRAASCRPTGRPGAGTGIETAGCPLRL